MIITYFLVNKIRKLTKSYERIKCFREYADIHRVVVLVDLEQAEAVGPFVQSLIQDGKEVFCLTFNPNDKVEPPVLPENMLVLNRKSLSFNGFPLHDVMENFKLLNPDTLVNLTVQPHPVLQFLALTSQASFRIGFLREEKTMDDLLLEYDSEQPFDFLTGQLHFYMKSLRSK